MNIQSKNKNGHTALLNPKKELLIALHPLRRIKWICHFIKKLQKSQTHMPEGENANTERFILGLLICLCLFTKNHSSLMKYGKLLKNYTNDYAANIPDAQAPLITHKLNEFIAKTAKKS